MLVIVTVFDQDHGNRVQVSISVNAIMDARSFLARHNRRLPRYTSYPTAPLFSSRVGPDILAGWLTQIPGRARLSLYVHVPFCDKLCWFCGCNTTVVHSVSALERYAEAVQIEIGRVAAAIGRRLPVAHVHWGGGTPTSLPAPLMRAIDTAIGFHFDTSNETEVAIEIDPRTLPSDAAATLTALRITRVSLGVQDFAPAVQTAIGRHQSLEETRSAAQAARKAGATSVNIDLVYGLPYQTVESLTATISSVLTLKPDRVALFGYAHVPWIQKRQQVLAEQALPDFQARFAQQERAAELLVAAGYCRIGLDHFAKPGDRMAEASGTPALTRNFQGYTVDAGDALIGFGASAISSLPQGYAQNETPTANYLRAIEAGGLATARGIELSCEDRLRRTIIERIMCDCRVDIAAMAEDARMSPVIFNDALQALDTLAKDGLVCRDGWTVLVPERGRPFLRNVAACFDSYLNMTDSSRTMRHAAAI